MAGNLSSERARAIGQIGGLTTSSRVDPKAHTTPARTAFLESFLDEVDPDRVLPEAERNRRAEAARKAHFQRLALKSAEARRTDRTESEAAV